MSRLYPDSKTFVDKKLKHPVGKIIRNFETLVKEQNGDLLTIEQIKQVKSTLVASSSGVEIWIRSVQLHGV